MSIDYNEFSAFLTSGLGIIIQIVLFLGGVITLLKYLDQRFDDRIKDEVNKNIDPRIAQLCKDLGEIATKLHGVEVETGTAIEYINRAIMHLQTGQDDREIRDYH